MSGNHLHIRKTTITLLIIAASLFCVLFGQGTHFHDLDIHIGNHLDVHAHVHAHESNDQPSQEDSNQDNHQHEVNKATDIIGTLTTSIQVKPEEKAPELLSLDEGHKRSDRILDETPTIFDLPPPKSAARQYHLSSFSLRGPPLA
ncbi:hypothetical protein [Fodinibius sediminis]|uniref:Uncharacterized protein n=1 Tax=Fodinibius sediminis TaxID=1214077 RepID=A0A521BQ85_9BACT|nr:hypothetical protein [Fodinibius sediminis]SMO49269.1 hypothetical protein SAMN06265218_103303 [Fodinibius sediminis]